MQFMSVALHLAAFLPTTAGSRAVWDSGGKISSRCPGKMLSSVCPVNFLTVLQATIGVANITNKIIESIFLISNHFGNRGVSSWIIT